MKSITPQTEYQGQTALALNQILNQAVAVSKDAEAMLKIRDFGSPEHLYSALTLSAQTIIIGHLSKIEDQNAEIISLLEDISAKV